jgi:hypothetical protein
MKKISPRRHKENNETVTRHRRASRILLRHLPSLKLWQTRGYVGQEVAKETQRNNYGVLAVVKRLDGLG